MEAVRRDYVLGIEAFEVLSTSLLASGLRL